ncbi:UBX domain-containing protein 4 [Phtheirospermum japonicum]|uniref:UBX domain-containing protein 4 n=1 Tax=Phtheirospermum japonicum TaxID=374723 RepID=A0A830B885_9LAMI|nr:UBX domain-containing protein 4 [Phtheirospermum japonicum]
MMDQSLSSLAFRGSIVEAIAEAKLQKKLFVVYTAGDDPASKLLETSTWFDPKVSEALSKYCILLQILEGSSEASNFSAIYPQHSAPCITAIGYNGVQLWQKEGFVSADVLASSLEKAWLSLHVQETTAAFLTAALASGNQLASGSSETALSEQETSGAYVSTQSTDGDILSLDVGQPLHSEGIEDRSDNEDASKETNVKQNDVPFPAPSLANVLDNAEFDESVSKTETENTSGDPFDNQNDATMARSVPQKNLDKCDNHLGSSNEVSREIVNEISEVAFVNTEDATEVAKADASDFSAVKSSDVFLNIRLPDGSGLRVTFSVMDTLRMIKEYINENQTSSLGSFSIAIPYPRKVFNDQDLLRIRSVTSPSAAQESQTGIWQYGPNASLENTPRNEGGRLNSSMQSSNQGTTPSSSSSKGSRFGANIHTLKHDDDDDSRFNDRNAFWNGNSTQFGGNDDESK